DDSSVMESAPPGEPLACHSAHALAFESVLVGGPYYPRPRGLANLAFANARTAICIASYDAKCAACIMDFALIDRNSTLAVAPLPARPRATSSEKRRRPRRAVMLAAPPPKPCRRRRCSCNGAGARCGFRGGRVMSRLFDENHREW